MLRNCPISYQDHDGHKELRRPTVESEEEARIDIPINLGGLRPITTLAANCAQRILATSAKLF